MKRAILLIVFSAILSNSVFSQIIAGGLKVTSFKRLHALVGFEKSQGFLNCSEKENRLLCPNFLSESYSVNMNPIKGHEGIMFSDKMPCMIPKGYFPSKISVPDSTKKYTLLIKRL